MDRIEILTALSKEIAMQTLRLSKMTGYEKEFKQMSYSIWAMKEMYQLLKMNPKRSPISVLDDFRADMDYYAVRNPKTSYIFSVAFDTATFFYDFCFGDVPWEGQSVTD